MLGKVIVTADENGQVIGVSENNPEYGFIRIAQMVTTINEEGWLRNSKRSTLIKGRVEDLQAAGYREGQELPGRIIVKERTEAFANDPQFAEKELKRAGATGVVCRIDDQPIYRQTFYTLNENAQDELLMHTNGDEIRQAQAALKAISALRLGTKTKEEVSL